MRAKVDRTEIYSLYTTDFMFHSSSKRGELLLIIFNIRIRTPGKYSRRAEGNAEGYGIPEELSRQDCQGNGGSSRSGMSSPSGSTI